MQRPKHTYPQSSTMAQKLQSTFIITIYIEQTETQSTTQRTINYLLSGGGCVLRTNPDIITQPILNFSNGNCELLITECTQLETIIVTVYRPPVPNSALNKLIEVLDIIQQKLTQKEDKENVRITLTGDFNSPPKVVEWVNSEEGVLPNEKPDNTPEKVALSLLLEQ